MCFQKLLKLPELRSDSVNFQQLLKTQVMLVILNFTRIDCDYLLPPQNPRRHYRNPRVIENMNGITRKNLESLEQGAAKDLWVTYMIG